MKRRARNEKYACACPHCCHIPRRRLLHIHSGPLSGHRGDMLLAAYAMRDRRGSAPSFSAIIHALRCFSAAGHGRHYRLMAMIFAGRFRCAAPQLPAFCRAYAGRRLVAAYPTPKGPPGRARGMPVAALLGQGWPGSYHWSCADFRPAAGHHRPAIFHRADYFFTQGASELLDYRHAD